jgi:S1-C subfamily serine protease
VNVYRRVSPAVVHVEITDSDRTFLGRPQTGSGSGFVLDRNGHVVTNDHVVRDADRIRVVFGSGQQFDAEVVSTDPAIDLAIIRVDAPADILHPVELGNSDVLQVGQRAIAIGNPFQFDQSMTVGIVSALGRVVDPTESGDFVPGLIQTDAAINPGNSGGPLLDSRGRVIGINTLIFTETGTSVGVGFAVPVNALRRSLPALLEGRRVGRPWLGIAGPPEITTELAQELQLPSQNGAYVNYIFPGGPADEAGLIAANAEADSPLQPGGDFITAVEGQPVDSFNELLNYLNRETRVGQTVDLTVVRGDRTQELAVTLGERPDGQ